MYYKMNSTKPAYNQRNKNTDIAILAENLGKRFDIYEKQVHRLRDILPYTKGMAKHFWAIRGISFELKKGRTLGIVGQNGSGKSTLLQLLSGILSPSEGSYSCRGRIGALLELGSGFNPEFTGIENIFLNASLLGISHQETNENLGAILEFAGIGDFAHQPVKTYSSGMSIRLAFAVQSLLRPDILIVDEALAVGDELFQKKCYNHIRSLKETGTSILLVTHNSHQVLEHCDEALLLHKGEQLLLGPPKIVTGAYQRLMSARVGEDRQKPLQSLQKLIDKGTDEADISLVNSNSHLASASSVVFPENHGRIRKVEILDENDCAVDTIDSGARFSVRFHYEVDQDFFDLRFGCHITNGSGIRITGQGFSGDLPKGCCIKAHNRFSIDYHYRDGLLPGLYFIGGGFWEANDPSHYIHRVLDYKVLKIVASKISSSFGVCDLSAAKPTIRLNL